MGQKTSIFIFFRIVMMFRFIRFAAIVSGLFSFAECVETEFALVMMMWDNSMDKQNQVCQDKENRCSYSILHVLKFSAR